MKSQLYDLLEERRAFESSQEGLRGKLKAAGAAIFGKPTQNQERALKDKVLELRLHASDAADRLVWSSEGSLGVILANLYALIRLRSDYPEEGNAAVAMNQAEQIVADVRELDDFFVDLIARRCVTGDEMRQLEGSVETLRVIGADKAIAVMSEAMPLFLKMTDPPEGYDEEYS